MSACRDVIEEENGRYRDIGCIVVDFWSGVCSRVGERVKMRLHRIPDVPRDEEEECGSGTDFWRVVLLLGSWPRTAEQLPEAPKRTI